MNNKRTIISMLVIITGMLIVSMINTDPGKTQNKKDNTDTGVKILNEQEFKTHVYNFDANKEWHYEGDHPAVLEFYADWCMPCRRMAPILEELATEHEGEVHIYKVNVSKEQRLASIFGVRSIPAFLFIPVEGEPTGRKGYMSKTMLIQEIDKLLAQ